MGVRRGASKESEQEKKYEGAFHQQRIFGEP
jgi:hypothetical protein